MMWRVIGGAVVVLQMLVVACTPSRLALVGPRTWFLAQEGELRRDRAQAAAGRVDRPASPSFD
jgi:hypothetical protein